MHLIDNQNGSTYDLNAPIWRGNSGGPLSLPEQSGISRNQIRQDVRSMWRYAAAFHTEVEDPVSMGEGFTPLVFRKWGNLDIGFKLEWMSPTGSFKDRGASFLISILNAQDVSSILEDSSGSGGGAMAAYAAAAGMKVKILVPSYAQRAKMVNIQTLNAEIQRVEGTRQDTAEEAVRQSDRVFYASHNWHPFFIEGVKTLAYELWEDLDFQQPDNIVIPAGSGTSVLGCFIGFQELHRIGEIKKLPRLLVVQPAHCCPIHRAYRGLSNEFEVRPTIAEGAAVSKPVRLVEVLNAIRKTSGLTLTVSESEIATGLKDLGRLGFYVEPTCAMVAPALDKLIDCKIIQPEQKTVVLLTGTGLKATEMIEKVTSESVEAH